MQSRAGAPGAGRVRTLPWEALGPGSCSEAWRPVGGGGVWPLVLSHPLGPCWGLGGAASFLLSGVVWDKAGPGGTRRRQALDPCRDSPPAGGLPAGEWGGLSRPNTGRLRGVGIQTPPAQPPTGCWGSSHCTAARRASWIYSLGRTSSGCPRGRGPSWTRGQLCREQVGGGRSPCLGLAAPALGSECARSAEQGACGCTQDPHTSVLQGPPLIPPPAPFIRSAERFTNSDSLTSHGLEVTGSTLQEGKPSHLTVQDLQLGHPSSHPVPMLPEIPDAGHARRSRTRLVGGEKRGAGLGH